MSKVAWVTRVITASDSDCHIRDSIGVIFVNPMEVKIGISSASGTVIELRPRERLPLPILPLGSSYDLNITVDFKVYEGNPVKGLKLQLIELKEVV